MMVDPPKGGAKKNWVPGAITGTVVTGIVVTGTVLTGTCVGTNAGTNAGATCGRSTGANTGPTGLSKAGAIGATTTAAPGAATSGTATTAVIGATGTTTPTPTPPACATAQRPVPSTMAAVRTIVVVARISTPPRTFVTPFCRTRHVHARPGAHRACAAPRALAAIQTL